MHGYDDTSYGRAFADVYDDWYESISDAGATALLIDELAGPSDGDAVTGAAVTGAAVLELGAGTGRLAFPMRDRGLRVTAVDVSSEMLDQLVAADPEGTVEPVLGDMVDDLPAGPFDIALIAYNTLFNLNDEQRQSECFAAVARSLRPGGRFVIEAFVPGEPFRSGDDISIRTMAADAVVLSLSRFTADDQRAEGQFVELTEEGGVRLRPWAVRYITVEQLDAMAAAAGFELEHRWADVHRAPFNDDSDTQLSVYRLAD